MSRTQIWYEVVQVVSRKDDQSLAEWFPGDEKYATLNSAREVCIRYAEEFPGTEYQVISVSLTEIGTPKIATTEVRK